MTFVSLLKNIVKMFLITIVLIKMRDALGLLAPLIIIMSVKMVAKNVVKGPVVTLDNFHNVKRKNLFLPLVVNAVVKYIIVVTAVALVMVIIRPVLVHQRETLVIILTATLATHGVADHISF